LSGGVFVRFRAPLAFALLRLRTLLWSAGGARRQLIVADRGMIFVVHIFFPYCCIILALIILSLTTKGDVEGVQALRNRSALAKVNTHGWCLVARVELN
jgi:hypothetical protein